MDQFGNVVTGDFVTHLYAGLLFNLTRTGLAVTQLSGIHSVTVTSSTPGDFYLEVLWDSVPVSNSKSVKYTFSQ